MLSDWDYKTKYIYAWGNNSKRKKMQGRQCVILHRLKKNSCIIKFLDNGQEECVSRNALRKAKEQI